MASGVTSAFLDNPDGGTHVEIRVAKAKPKDRAFLAHACAEFEKHITSEFAGLRQMLEHPEQTAAMIDEPALPVSAERFLTNPIHTH